MDKPRTHDHARLVRFSLKVGLSPMA